jgi:adenylate kinase
MLTLLPCDKTGTALVFGRRFRALLARRAARAASLGALLIGAAFAQGSGAPVIVLIGPPGAGKSTQAASIQKKYRFAMITREQLMQDDPALLARNRQPEIAGVEPRADPALNKLFLRRLEQTGIRKGLLLDGYPATKDHADFLRQVVEQKGLGQPLVLQLNVPDDVVRERLKGQSPATIEQNLKDYHREMDFVAVYYPQADIVAIDGNKKPKAVFRQIQQALKQRLKQK